MQYPVQATVNTGKFTHPDWKNGDTVWVLANKNGVCDIAKKKGSPSEGNLRRDALVFQEEES